MKNRWYKDAVVYQIYPRSFCDSNGDGIGDIKGITSKIEYLKDLGINAVWLNPVYKSPNKDNGYDISDYRDIMDEFGTLDDFKEMLEKFHKNGIKVIMDLVVNHTSDQHKWFQESKKSKDNPYRDYYIWRKGRGKDGKKPPNNWTSRFMGPAWEYDEASGEFYMHLFAKGQPDLNWNNPKVRQEVADICNYWFDMGVDGFRCDVLTYISKPDDLPDGKFNLGLIGDEHFTIGPNYHKYIKELNEKSWSKYDSFIVAEAIGTGLKDAVALTDENNKELDSLFHFDLANVDAILQFIPKKVDLVKFKKIINDRQNLPATTWNSNYYENHDQPRSLPRLADGGDLMEAGKMLAVSLLMIKGTPFIYQGEELGMTNCAFKKEEMIDVMATQIMGMFHKISPLLDNWAYKVMLKRARDHARTPMQWNGRENGGFTTGKPWMVVNPNYTEINAEKEQSDENSLLNFYKKVIHFKLGNEIAINGNYIEYLKKNKNLFVFERRLENKSLFVICNFKNKDIKFTLPEEINYKNCELKISNNKDAGKLESCVLKPYETRIYELEY